MGLFDSVKDLAGIAAPIAGYALGGVPGALLGSSISSAYSGNQAASDAMGMSQDQYNQTRSDLEPYRLAGNNALNQYTGQIGSYNKNLPQFNGGNRLNSFEGGDRFNFNLEGDKGYQFAMDEAMKQANRGMASQGGYNSGNRLAALTDRATGVASQYANDAYNRQLGESNTNYGRGVTEYGLNADANNTNYGRGLTEFGIASDQERDLYGRNQNYLNQLSNLAGSGQNAAAQLGGFGAQNTSNQINANQFGVNSLNNAVQGGISNYLTYDYLNPSQNYVNQDMTDYSWS